MATEDSSQPVLEMVEATAATNVKVVAEGPAFFTNVIYGNSVSNQQNINTLSMTILSKATENLMNTSPSEGIADVVAAMQGVKAGQTTPPVYPNP